MQQSGPNPQKRVRIAGTILLIAGMTIALWAFFSFGGLTESEIIQPRPVDAPGTDTQPQAGCELNNGYQVCDTQDGATVLSFYRKSQGILGKALTSYDPVTRRQVFVNGIVWLDPNEPQSGLEDSGS
jgi:hypothetical protein